MTFEAYEAVLMAQAEGLPMLLAPAALADAERGNAGTLQAALRAAVAAEGAASEAAEAPLPAERPAEGGPEPDTPRERWAAMEAAGILDLAVERGGSELLRGFDPADHPRLAGNWLARLLGEAPAIDSGAGAEPAHRPAAIVGTSTTPGGNWVDKNGNGQYDEGEEIVVEVAKTTPHFWTGTGTGTGGGNTGGTPGAGTGGQPTPTPPEIECLSSSEEAALTPQQREAYEVAKEAAEIAREIMQKSDRDLNEYGALIYRDINGVITHTPLTRGTPTAVHNINITGLPGYGSLLAIVHSHTAATWTGTDFKLFPTPGQGGDWTAFDTFVRYAYDDLVRQGYSHTQALSKTSSMHQFVLGPKGPAGTGLYELHKYHANDRDIQTLGQKVPRTLGQCSG